MPDAGNSLDFVKLIASVIKSIQLYLSDFTGELQLLRL